MQKLSRRQSIASVAAFGATALIYRTALAATPTEDIIKKFAVGRKVNAGKIILTIPEIAENGGSVPVSVKVDSPMTDASYVSEIIIIAEDNPMPTAASLKLTPLSGKAEVAMRLRLAKTQTVRALARMNDGSVFIDMKTVKVTVGGCGG